MVMGTLSDLLQDEVFELRERIAELEAQIKAVAEIHEEMGEDTSLGSGAIGKGVLIIGRYLERLEEALQQGEDT